MRKLFGIKIKNIIVIWIFVDLLINIGLFICGFFISKSLALSFNPYLWLIVSLIGNFVLSSVVSFDKWKGFVDSWQIVAIIITCMHTISAVYLVIAVIASIITIFNIMNDSQKYFIPISVYYDGCIQMWWKIMYERFEINCPTNSWCWRVLRLSYFCFNS